MPLGVKPVNGESRLDKRQALGYRRGMNEPWRKRLEAALEASGKDMKQVSIEAGLGPSYIRDAIKRDRTPKYQNLQKVALALGTTAEFIMTGRDGHTPQVTVDIDIKSIRLIPVIGQAAAGRWMEFDDMAIAYNPISAVQTDYEGDQFAVQVVGNSMDLRNVLNGSYVICVPYSDRAAKNGNMVVIERRRGHEFQRLVKEIHFLSNGRVELRSRSSDPSHQSIFVDMSSWVADDGTEIVMRGIVAAIHIPVL